MMTLQVWRKRHQTPVDDRLVQVVDGTPVAASGQMSQPGVAFSIAQFKAGKWAPKEGVLTKANAARLVEDAKLFETVWVSNVDMGVA